MVTFVALALLFAAAINIYWYFADGRGEDFIKQARELKKYAHESKYHQRYNPLHSDWIGNIYHGLYSGDYDDD